MAAKAKKTEGKRLDRKITPKLWAKQSTPFDGSAVVLGIARRYEDVNTTYGTSARFRGDFGAAYTHPETGERTEARSNQLFVPRIVESMLIEAIDAAMHAANGDTSAVAVQFGFRIYQSPIAPKAGRAPYEWAVESVLPVASTETDMIAALLAEHASDSLTPAA